MAKRLANAQSNADLKAAIELEKQTSAFLFGTEDHVERTLAFLEKRSPVWRGR